MCRRVELTAGQVWIISKASEPTQARTMNRLLQSQFMARAELSLENVRLCRKAKGKVEICRDLKITHFVDDCHDNLVRLSEEVTDCFWFAGKSQNPESAKIKTVRDWSELMRPLDC